MKVTLVTVVMLFLSVPVAEAHNNRYAFSARDVRGRQVGLRYVSNQLFPAFGPHEVRCWGLGPVRLQGGGRGFVHIRCRVETMNVPDFIYHHDARGKVVATRSW